MGGIIVAQHADKILRERLRIDGRASFVRTLLSARLTDLQIGKIDCVAGPKLGFRDVKLQRRTIVPRSTSIFGLIGHVALSRV
jgi:hypothetical protein